MTDKPTKSILLVEDNMGDARLLREMLREPGCEHVQLSHVQTILEAEESLTKRHIDVVLLDLGLPDVQGLEALERTRAAAPGTPVMVLTGLDDQALAVRALHVGAQDYLIKDQLTTKGLMRALCHSIERHTMEEALFAEKERAVAMNQELVIAYQKQRELTVTAETLNEQLQAEVSVSRQVQAELTARDLHDRAMLKEKNVLLGEIHHRVKNNLQIVNSLLDLQSAQIHDPAVFDMLRVCQHRIRSMALIHQTLYQSNDFAQVDFGMFLNSLAPAMVQSYIEDSERVLLSINVVNMHLPINAAVPCGLLLNELISNCLKHAFPGGRHGRIDIDFVREDGEYAMLTVSDDGVGIPENFDLSQTESLGMQLVFLLADQIGGTMTVNRSNPTSFILRFKINDPASTTPISDVPGALSAQEQGSAAYSLA